jgi:hypothetical protein
MAYTYPKLAKGESSVDSKRIAFYIVLKFPTAAGRLTDGMEEFTSDKSGAVWVKAVRGNMIELNIDTVNTFAKSRGAVGFIFLRKANIEARLGAKFDR